MTYLFLGEDLNAKDSKIAEIKARAFKDPQALHFDVEHLDAKELTPDALKKVLLTLPVVASKRLIIIRQMHKLRTADAAILISFLKNPYVPVDMILESSETALKGDLTPLTQYATPVLFGQKSQREMFDVTRMITAGRTAEALKVLHELLSDNLYPLQAMPVFIWYWGKEGRALGKAKFKQGLKALEEADLNIKRSRLDPAYALEKLVVELAQLRART